MSIKDSAIEYRPAVTTDIDAMIDFILEHGPNPWNYLPENGVRKHLNNIKSQDTLGVIAEVDGQMVGFVTCNIGDYFPQYESVEGRKSQRGYIAEAVVSKAYVGRGIGTRLLEEGKRILQSKGMKTIYIDRHEENAPSAGMMRKAGLEHVDTFDDPERRFVGTKRTSVLRFVYD